MEEKRKKINREEERLGEAAGQARMRFAHGFNYFSHLICSALCY